MPSGVALSAEDFTDLLRELGEVVAQRLEIGCDVAGRFSCGLFDLAKAVAGIFRRIANVLRCR